MHRKMYAHRVKISARILAILGKYCIGIGRICYSTAAYTWELWLWPGHTHAMSAI